MAVDASKIRSLRGALGADADRVQFADMAVLGAPSHAYRDDLLAPFDSPLPPPPATARIVTGAGSPIRSRAG